MQRESYQQGHVRRRPRKRGPDVWELMYRDGDQQKTIRIGTVQKYKSQAAAEKAAFALRAELNSRLECVYFRELVERYRKDELDVRKSSLEGYEAYLSRLLERWANERLDGMAKDIVSIEAWLRDLETKLTKNLPGRPLAKSTKKHIRFMLLQLFEAAIKWGYLPMARNPIELVKVKGPNVPPRKAAFGASELYEALLNDRSLPVYVRTIIRMAMMLGPRISEILGLRWENIDFDNMTISIERSSVGKYQDGTKTPSSRDTLPMDPLIAGVLQQWRAYQPSVNGWVFGNPATGRPYWRNAMLKRYLQPAALKLGVQNFGRHSFRHTYRGMSGDMGLAPEIQQALIHPSSVIQTMKYATKGEMLEKAREANAKIVELLPQIEHLPEQYKAPTSKSGFRGVYFEKGNGKYTARIAVGGKKKYLGFFQTAEEAAKVWDAEAKRLGRPKGVLNFPSDLEAV